MGQVTNVGSTSQGDIEVAVTFFADDGSSVASDLDRVFVETMPAGATLPFEIVVESAVAPAEYATDVWSTPGETTVRDDLQIVDPQLMYTGGNALIAGQVHNPGPDLGHYAELIATLYSVQGKVIAVGYELIDGEELEAAESTPFDIPTDGLSHLVVDYVVIALGF